MTRFLYLVRHGRADPHDGPLSHAGQEQARLTGRRLTTPPTCPRGSAGPVSLPP